MRVACQQTNVLVQPRGLGIVIARADVSVATNAVGLLAHNQRGLGVGLESNHAVGHVHARVLQLSRPTNIARLVKARAQFNQHRNLLSTFGGLNEAGDKWTIATCAVQTLLDAKHFWILRGLLNEVLDAGLETFIRVVQQHVALANSRENIVVSMANLRGLQRSPWAEMKRRIIQICDLVQRSILQQSVSLINIRLVNF